MAVRGGLAGAVALLIVCLGVVPATACEIASVRDQLRASDRVVEGRVAEVRIVRVWFQDWRFQTLREAEVSPIATHRGAGAAAGFTYRFSSVDPACGKPDRAVRPGQTLMFMFNDDRQTPFSFLTVREYAAPDLDHRF